ncbi:hemK methyltransferase family member 1 [Lates japonicus]|uniref:peptide chain release factor N(5)-glutamine methyltransferase n=1 Tax=Lates japonicus TaxID=270547 RepID=A0AAD3MZD4_LATJO|nr:hemK methyltransferase family member 1 [Lates japonicus]
MWRSSVRAGYRCFGCRNVGPKGIWGSHAVRTCSAPALPAGRITALQAVDLWKRHFEERGVTEPDHSSHYILAHLLGAKTIESVEQGKLTELLSREKTEQMWELCTRRLSRMPVQYVIEEWDFRDLTLKMKPPVFIPRPETEELVELVLSDLEMKPGTGATADAQLTCLEVGCGSGAISLSLLKSLPQLKAIALDQSQDAVDLTRENALRLGLQDRLHIYHIDVMKDAESVLSLCSSVSAVVSNPPYLFSEDMASLEPEILRETYLSVKPATTGPRLLQQPEVDRDRCCIIKEDRLCRADPAQGPRKSSIREHVGSSGPPQRSSTRHNTPEASQFNRTEASEESSQTQKKQKQCC